MRSRPGIYQILNVSTGKRYIGSAKNTAKRLKQHLTALIKGKHDNERLQRSFNKYGAKAFCFIIVEYCKVKQLIEREQFWIDHFWSANDRFGYNINPIASKPPGASSFTEESVAKISARHKGKPKPLKQRLKIGKAIQASWDDPSPERQAQRKRQQLNPPMLGKKHKLKSRKQMSQAHLNPTSEAAANIAAGHDRYWSSDRGKKHLAKLAEANERRHQEALKRKRKRSKRHASKKVRPLRHR